MWREQVFYAAQSRPTMRSGWAADTPHLPTPHNQASPCIDTTTTSTAIYDRLAAAQFSRSLVTIAAGVSTVCTTHLSRIRLTGIRLRSLSLCFARFAENSHACGRGSTMLCEICSRIFSSSVKEGDHHASLASLTEAAAEGCYICAPLLKYATKEAGFLENCRDRFSSVWGNDARFDDSGSFTIYSRMRGMGEEVRRNRQFLVVPQAVLPVRTSVYGRDSAIPTNECLAVVQKWISSCLDEHEQCQKHNLPQTYPTRLLELEGSDLRLVFPQNDKPLGPYAALSYCWGPNPSFIRLTADNLQRFRIGLPCTSLPIAFQEAVLILKELGIRYLWIDALCIIQGGPGSSEDWQFESGRMQEVYSNCIVNLSLAQAAHPNQSCLEGYTLGSTPPFEADIVYGGDDAGNNKPQTYTILSQDYFREAIYQQPIGSRAWVMQERLLATRVLSIGHGELFWDCQQVHNANLYHTASHSALTFIKISSQGK
jgi:hypothetical protein